MHRSIIVALTLLFLALAPDASAQRLNCGKFQTSATERAQMLEKLPFREILPTQADDQCNFDVIPTSTQFRATNADVRLTKTSVATARGSWFVMRRPAGVRLTNVEFRPLGSKRWSRADEVTLDCGFEARPTACTLANVVSLAFQDEDGLVWSNASLTADGSVTSGIAARPGEVDGVKFEAGALILRKDRLFLVTTADGKPVFRRDTQPGQSIEFDEGRLIAEGFYHLEGRATGLTNGAFKVTSVDSLTVAGTVQEVRELVLLHEGLLRFSTFRFRLASLDFEGAGMVDVKPDGRVEVYALEPETRPLRLEGNEYSRIELSCVAHKCTVVRKDAPLQY